MAAVEHGTLVVHAHSVHDLGEHLAQHSLADLEAVLRGQTGNFGEIRTCQRVHLMGRICGNDFSVQLIVDGQGHRFAFHNANGLHEFLRIDDVAAGLIHLGVDDDSDALFKVKGGHHAGVVLLCFKQNAFHGGQRALTGYRAHQRGYGITNFLSVKNDLHKFAPF